MEPWRGELSSIFQVGSVRGAAWSRGRLAPSETQRCEPTRCAPSGGGEEERNLGFPSPRETINPRKIQRHRRSQAPKMQIIPFMNFGVPSLSAEFWLCRAQTESPSCPTKERAGNTSKPGNNEAAVIAQEKGLTGGTHSERQLT